MGGVFRKLWPGRILAFLPAWCAVALLVAAAAAAIPVLVRPRSADDSALRVAPSAATPAHGLDRGRRVRGVVRRADGRPIPAARVFLVDVAAAERSFDGKCSDWPAALDRIADLAPPAEGTRIADAAGTFEFLAPAPGLKVLVAVAPGFQAAVSDRFSILDGIPQGPRPMTLASAAPLRFASPGPFRVELVRPLPLREAWEVCSAPEGSIERDGPAGGGQILVRYATPDRGMRAAIVVVDPPREGDPGAALPDADPPLRVTPVCIDDPRCEGGLCRLRSVSVRETFPCPGLPEGTVLRGRVTRRSGDEPIEGLLVQAAADWDARAFSGGGSSLLDAVRALSRLRGTAATGPDGTFELRVRGETPLATVGWVRDSRGHVLRQPWPASGDAAWTVGGGGALEVASRPFERALLLGADGSVERSTVLSAGGEGRFEGVPPGRRRVKLEGGWYPTYPRGAVVSPGGLVRIDIAGADVRSESETGPVLDGFVLDPAGAPVAGASLVIQAMSGPQRFLKTATTDAQGFYRVGGVPEHEPLMVGFSTAASDLPTVRQFLRTMATPADEFVHVDLLKLSRAVTVRLRDRAGRPWRGPVSIGFDEGEAGVMFHAATPDGDGAVRLPGLAPGRYRVTGEPQGSAPPAGRFAVDPSATSVDVTLEVTLAGD